MRLLVLFVLVAPLAADAGEPLPVSPHHLSAPAPQAKDASTFVAGVRHCPRAELR
jgi:hypothetical protein